jgi:hypothetical protein
MSKREEDISKVFEWLRGKGFAPTRTFSTEKSRRRPDLLMPVVLQRQKGNLERRGYLAIECKPGEEHDDILDGIDSVINQALDYALGAKYHVGSRDEEIEIIGFALATSYSREGILYEKDKQFEEVKVKGGWGVRPMVFTQTRILWRLALNTEKSIRSILTIGAKERLKARGLQPFPPVGVIIEKGSHVIAMLNIPEPKAGWHPWTLLPWTP